MTAHRREERATVTADGRRFEVPAGETFTFGRDPSCTLCLDRQDRGISRIAGSLTCLTDVWWLSNVSETRLLIVVDEQGVRLPLGPGRLHAIDQVHVSVIVAGSTLYHELRITVPAPAMPRAAAASGRGPTPTLSKEELSFTEADYLALVALFSGYLESFPRYEPHPTSYAIAAKRLGWKRSTLMKRIENMRVRLTRVGVPGLVGDKALEALAEFVLVSGIITRADLARLPHR